MPIRSVPACRDCAPAFGREEEILSSIRIPRAYARGYSIPPLRGLRGPVTTVRGAGAVGHSSRQDTGFSRADTTPIRAITALP